MKTALITTTINVPTVLALYRKLGPEVRFFVAIDEKTPEEAVNFLAHDLPNVDVGYIQNQEQWKCSELIGWNTVRRRNIALLEALKWGAKIIVTIDDDNIPIGPDYFVEMRQRFYRSKYTPAGPKSVEHLFEGIKAISPSGWFDAGQLMIPQTPHRGFPYDKKAQPIYQPIVDAKIGVVAGLCLGDPDIDAATRIVSGPIVHGVSELARSGVVVDPRETWTVFNTQNTAFLRELAPAMFCAPGLGRFDDIVASLITQRVMRERGLHVHFGQPFVWQQRNSHNLITDLEEEVWGMKHLTWIAASMDAMGDSINSSVTGYCRQIWQAIPVPDKARECALAFLDDCETVL